MLGGERGRGYRVELLVGGGLIVSTALLLVSDVLFDIVRYQHGAFVEHSTDVITAGAGKAATFRWAGVTDMLGSYLLLLPAVIYLWRRLPRGEQVVVDVISGAGAAFCVVGAAAAAIYAYAGEALIRDYAHASPAAQADIVRTFSTLDTIVTTALWQTVDGILLATWLIGIAVLLRRVWPWFSRYCVVNGALAAAVALGLILGQQHEGAVPLTIIFLPLNVLETWLAVLILRSGLPAPADT